MKLQITNIYYAIYYLYGVLNSNSHTSMNTGHETHKHIQVFTRESSALQCASACCDEKGLSLGVTVCAGQAEAVRVTLSLSVSKEMETQAWQLSPLLT